MPMNENDNSKPYTLFKPKNSKRWWVRFSITGQGQQRISLGTQDEKEAKQRAQEEWYGARALDKAGLSVTKKRFPDIAEEFIAQIQHEVNSGQKMPYDISQFAPIIRRYFYEHFGNRQLASISAADIDAYWPFRESYWTTGPGRNVKFICYERTTIVDGFAETKKLKRPVRREPPKRSTLSKEAMLLRQMFEFGLKRKYTLEVPKITLPKDNRRKVDAKPGFTLKEFLHLAHVSERRVAEAEAQGAYQSFHRKRLALHCYCMVAAFTGMRPTELIRLIWNDIGERQLQTENGLPYDMVVIQARGKGKERETVAQPEVMSFLKTMKELFYLDVGRFPTGVDPVFANAKGEPIKSYKIGLAELLSAAELRFTPDGRRRDSGSFRPFYISQQIREGVNPHILIRNVGTSGKMVMEHYNKILPAEEIDKLTPDWLNQRVVKPIMKNGS